MTIVDPVWVEILHLCLILDGFKKKLETTDLCNSWEKTGDYIFFTWKRKTQMDLENHIAFYGLPCGASSKEPTCQCRRYKRCGFDPRSPGGGHGNPLVFLPGESHRQKSLVGYRP